MDKALKFGKNLLATAARNYTNKYQQDLSQLVQALRQPGSASQPLIQGITPGIIPGIAYDPNAPLNQNPYGQNAPYDSNPDYEDQYGQKQGYSHGITGWLLRPSTRLCISNGSQLWNGFFKQYLST